MRLSRASAALAATLFAGASLAQLTPRIEAARDAMEAGETDRARAMFTEITRSESLREAATAVY